MVGEQQELSLEQLGSWLGYADDSIIEQVLARFLCSRNKEVEEFLLSFAIAFYKIFECQNLSSCNGANILC